MRVNSEELVEPGVSVDLEDMVALLLQESFDGEVWILVVGGLRLSGGPTTARAHW